MIDETTCERHGGVKGHRGGYVEGVGTAFRYGRHMVRQWQEMRLVRTSV